MREHVLLRAFDENATQAQFPHCARQFARPFVAAIGVHRCQAIDLAGIFTDQIGDSSLMRGMMPFGTSPSHL
jgi:hypothetical protein